VLRALARPPVAGAAPDLVPEVFDIALVTSDVIQGDVDEGCAGGTTGRRLLTFTLRARNLGPDPLVLGDPGCPDRRVYRGAPCTNPRFVCSLSHGHAHFRSFATAKLRDGNGTVLAQARKYGFCPVAFAGTCPTLTALTCDDDDPTTGALTSRITFAVTAGTPYILEVTDYAVGNGGTLNLALAP